MLRCVLVNSFRLVDRQDLQALRLDHLGNIVNDAPLNDLVQQNIIVKKFVYDNEIELEAPPVVKATRSRSKKKN